ncbi:MAG: hypothetical protein K9I68_06175 [Bacteroidales bacterium]|nr:hypothetical protein [Bacteroidales bacterium]MCF8338143.1 hypothetical protein [Bacteroidales bacterium]
MEKLAGFLLISGSGRKVGKTSLACEMIEKYHARGVVALKIAPHFHDLPDISQIIASGEGFRIIKETQNTQKDSSRMLKAGAVKSYYVQSIDKAIPKVLAQLEPEIGGSPVVCESGGLARFYQPALHVFIFDYRAGLEKLPEGIQPDFLLPSFGGKVRFPLERIGISHNFWDIR